VMESLLSTPPLHWSSREVAVAEKREEVEKQVD